MCTKHTDICMSNVSRFKWLWIKTDSLWYFRAGSYPPLSASLCDFWHFPSPFLTQWHKSRSSVAPDTFCLPCLTALVYPAWEAPGRRFTLVLLTVSIRKGHSWARVLPGLRCQFSGCPAMPGSKRNLGEYSLFIPVTLFVTSALNQFCLRPEPPEIIMKGVVVLSFWFQWLQSGL